MTYSVSDGAIPDMIASWLNNDLGVEVLHAPAIILTTLAYTDRDGFRRYQAIPWGEARPPTLAEAIMRLPRWLKKETH